MIVWTLQGSCRGFSDVPAGAQILSVNGRDAIGRCEGCGRVILDRQVYFSSEEGEMVCSQCMEPKPEARP